MHLLEVAVKKKGRYWRTCLQKWRECTTSRLRVLHLNWKAHSVMNIDFRKLIWARYLRFLLPFRTTTHTLPLSRMSPAWTEVRVRIVTYLFPSFISINDHPLPVIQESDMLQRIVYCADMRVQHHCQWEYPGREESGSFMFCATRWIASAIMLKGRYNEVSFSDRWSAGKCPSATLTVRIVPSFSVSIWRWSFQPEATSWTSPCSWQV